MLKYSKGTFVLTISLFYSIFILTAPVFADLINPAFYTKKCGFGEIQVECSYSSKIPFGPRTYNECFSYENNPDYTLLTGEGHSFGGRSKYCFKPVSTTIMIKALVSKITPQLIGTLLLELPIFFFMGFKRKRELLGIALVNILTVTIFSLFGIFTQMTIIKTLLAELLIIVSEVFLVLKLSRKPLNVVFKATVIANLVSAIFGTIGLFFIKILI